MRQTLEESLDAGFGVGISAPASSFSPTNGSNTKTQKDGITPASITSFSRQSGRLLWNASSRRLEMHERSYALYISPSSQSAGRTSRSG